MAKQQDNPYDAPVKVYGVIYVTRGSNVSYETAFEAIPWINTLSDDDIGKLSQEVVSHPMHGPVFAGPIVNRAVDWLRINGSDSDRRVVQTTDRLVSFGRKRHVLLHYNQTQRYISHLIATRAVDSLLSTYSPIHPEPNT